MEEQKKYIVNEFGRFLGGYDEYIHEGEIRLTAAKQSLEIIISKPKTKSSPGFLNVKVIKDKKETDLDFKAEVVRNIYNKVGLMGEMLRV